MRYLKTSEAAALLNVSPNTLRAWERRFSFPRPRRSEGHHRMYTHGEIVALRDALHDGLSISSAVSRAREGLFADGDTLLAALASYEAPRADLAMDAALAMRSLERAVEELLLPTTEEILRRHGNDSAAWAFAAAWSGDWLRRARRLTPPPVRQVSVLIGDATRDELDPATPHLHALELLCARAGCQVLTLSARAATGVADVVVAHPPNLVVIAGDHLDNDTVARWAYGARAVLPSTPVATFHRGEQKASLRLTSALPSRPSEAVIRMLELTGEATPAERPGRTQRRASA